MRCIEFDVVLTQFTCIDFTDGLTDTVEFASSVGVEEPIPIETRTPFRSVIRLFDMDRGAARIQGCPRIFALFDCAQHVI